MENCDSSIDTEALTESFCNSKRDRVVVVKLLAGNLVVVLYVLYERISLPLFERSRIWEMRVEETIILIKRNQIRSGRTIAVVWIVEAMWRQILLVRTDLVYILLVTIRVND